MGHGFNAVGRMCPPPRSLAAEANGASWSGPDAGPTEYKVAARCYAPKAGSPPIVSAADTAPATKPGAAIQTRYVTEDKAMPRGCKPEGERALSNAERQARHRARLHDQVPKPVIRYRRPTDRRSRAQRWCDAVSELVTLQPEYVAWLDALPDSLCATPTGEALQAIADLDLDALAAIDPPRGYGRD
jgi:hypothetical protein